MEFSTARDLSIVKLDQDKCLVIACDSVGAIGEKEQDQLQVPAKIVGKLTVRVAVMELLATGARPISIIDTLSVELVPTGEKIIAGIKEELELLGINELLNGSSEENMTSLQTGVGITAIGLVSRNELRLSSSNREDLAVAIGIPVVGEEVLINYDSIADLELVTKLLELDYVNEILPVGSKGILYEAELLAAENNLKLDLLASNLDLAKSAGPATVVLITLNEGKLKDLQKSIDKAINIIGRLI